MMISVSVDGEAPTESPLACSFCGHEPRGRDLVVGPRVVICSECIAAAVRALGELAAPAPPEEE